jgi:hypothetical protein
MNRDCFTPVNPLMTRFPVSSIVVASIFRIPRAWSKEKISFKNSGAESPCSTTLLDEEREEI